MKKDKFINAMLEIDDKYISAAAPGQPIAGRSAWVRIAAIAACLALLTIAAAVVLPFSRRNDPPPETLPPMISDPITDSTTSPGSEITTEIIIPETTLPTPPETTVQDPPETSLVTQPPDTSGDPSTEEVMWYSYAVKPFLIVRINEKTDQSVFGYYKIKCDVLLSHYAESVECFDVDNAEIYVLEKDLESIQVNGVYLTSIMSQKIDDKEYCLSAFYNRKKHDFTPFIDGKLANTELWAESIFQASYFWNETIEVIGEYTGALSEVSKAFPKEPIAPGMTVQDLAKFFEALEKAVDEYRKSHNGNVHCAS